MHMFNSTGHLLTWIVIVFHGPMYNTDSALRGFDLGRQTAKSTPRGGDRFGTKKNDFDIRLPFFLNIYVLSCYFFECPMSSVSQQFSIQSKRRMGPLGPARARPSQGRAPPFFFLIVSRLRRFFPPSAVMPSFFVFFPSKSGESGLGSAS